MGKRISAVLTGLLFMAAAVFVVLNAVGVIPFRIWDYWPMIFVLVGVPGLFGRGGRIFSLGMIAVGSLLTLRNIGVAPFDSLAVWSGIVLPVLLAVIGLSIIASVFRVGKVGGKKIDRGTTDMKDVSVVFGEKNIDYSGIEFKGLDASCVFGSMVIDLRNAIIIENCTIEVSGVFGSVEILTSGNAVYSVTGSQIFGSVNGGNSGTMLGIPTVTVEANAVFGSVDVK